MNENENAPAVSPVPPTAETLDSWDFVVEALEAVKVHVAEIGAGTDHLPGDWNKGHALACDECIDAVKRFGWERKVGPPFTEREQRMLDSYNAKVADFAAETKRASGLQLALDQINDNHGKFVQTLRTVIEENAETYTQEGMVIFLRSLLRDFEELLSPAPSVGELEWRKRPPADYGEWYVAGRWDIYKDDGEDGFRLHLEGVSEMPDDSAIVARGLTVDEAKSLANSLQRILSGAAEPLWTLKQIEVMLNYVTTAIGWDAWDGLGAVDELRKLFRAHMPDGQPRDIEENPLAPSDPLSDPEKEN